MRKKHFLQIVDVLLLVSFGFATEARAQWVQNNLPRDAYVSCFAVAGTRLFAGTDAGVFLSPDSGATWNMVAGGLPDAHVDALAASDSILVCGTYGGGVFLSRNHGASWSPAGTGLSDSRVGSLAVMGSRVFAGTMSSVFVSTNAGGTWSVVSAGPLNRFVYAFAASGSSIFAGTWGGVYLSTDSGASWTPVNAGLTNPWVFSLAVTGGKIYAGTGNGVFVSANNGGSWAPAGAGLTGRAVLGLAVGNTALFAGTFGGGVYVLSADGMNWIPVSTGLGNAAVRSLAACGSRLVAGTYFGGSWNTTTSDLLASFTAFSLSAGWNLVSVPRVPPDPGAPVLFPGAVRGTTYGYASGTYQQASAMNTGEGYWVLYDAPGVNAVSGTGFSSVSLSVPAGNRWVMIGSLTGSAPASALLSSPPGAIEPGTIYGWNGSSYVHPAMLEPGHGYWVLVKVPCTLNLSYPAAGYPGSIR